MATVSAVCATCGTGNSLVSVISHQCPAVLAKSGLCLDHSNGLRLCIAGAGYDYSGGADALDMSRCCSRAVQQKAVYQPTAISMHSGSTGDSGDYTAMCRSALTVQ